MSSRYCSFCLIPLEKKQIKTCARCHRRVYCSRGCQEADWKSPTFESPGVSPTATGMGQGHKNWCGLNYGEEGIDWEVRQIPGQRPGLFALRDLPPMYRILVEGIQTLDHPKLSSHPGFLFLPDPSANTVVYRQEFGMGRIQGLTEQEKKFRIHSVIYPETYGKPPPFWHPVLGLRMALAKHNCNGNAEFMADNSFNVLILYTRRSIATGEELTREYSHWQNPLLFPDMGVRERRLRDMWGYTCEANCVCKDPIRLATLNKLRYMFNDEYLGLKLSEAEFLRYMEKFLSLAESSAFPVNVMRDIHHTFVNQCGMQRNDLRNWETYMRGYMKKVVQFDEQLNHPKSKLLEKYRAFEAKPVLYAAVELAWVGVQPNTSFLELRTPMPDYPDDLFP